MGKTIITFLFDNSPQGPREIFIDNNPCRLMLIPRSSLEVINDRDDLKQPAFYMLLGEEGYEQPKAYLGETDNFFERIKNHDYKKEFWQKALVFTSKDETMNKADVLYLEHLAVALAHETKRYNISENKQVPRAPKLAEHQRSINENFFEDVKLLTSFIGCPIFEKIEQKGKHLFYTTIRGCNAKGFYDDNGFTVLEGSIIASDNTPSLSWIEKRNELLKDSTTLENYQRILKFDKVFSSPSTAASFVTGRSCNGWTTWVDDKGKTLDEVYRKRLEE